MELKPGYKKTEIGVIPEDWSIGKLSSSFPLQRGFDLPQSKAKEGCNPVVYSNGILNFHDEAMCKGPGVVTGRSGTLGKVFFIESDYWPHNTTLWVTNFKGNNPKYVFYLLSYLHTEKHGTGSGVPTLNRNDLHDLIVSLPPESEQKLITSVLTDIDSLITSLKKLIVKKKLIKQGVMQELLTGKRRLPGFSREWETKRLGDSLVFERPDKYIYWGKELKPKGAIPVLTANKSFILGYANEYAGVYNDVPAIIFDDFTTDCKYVRFPFKVKSSAIKILKPANHDVDLRFIFYTMQSTKFSIGDHKRYYISEYQHLKISLPKIDEQAAIADVIEDIEIEIDLHVKQLNKQILLKQAMMQELLTGRIRLV